MRFHALSRRARGRPSQQRAVKSPCWADDAHRLRTGAHKVLSPSGNEGSTGETEGDGGRDTDMVVVKRLIAIGVATSKCSLPRRIVVLRRGAWREMQSRWTEVCAERQTRGSCKVGSCRLELQRSLYMSLQEKIRLMKFFIHQGVGQLLTTRPGAWPVSDLSDADTRSTASASEPAKQRSQSGSPPPPPRTVSGVPSRATPSIGRACCPAKVHMQPSPSGRRLTRQRHPLRADWPHSATGDASNSSPRLFPQRQRSAPVGGGTALGRRSATGLSNRVAQAADLQLSS